MELNQLLEGSNNYKTLQADAQRLSGKWAKSGLLEGISNVNDRNNMAMILENQAKQIVSEAIKQVTVQSVHLQVVLSNGLE
jgi:hypothetical protein